MCTLMVRLSGLCLLVVALAPARAQQTRGASRPAGDGGAPVLVGINPPGATIGKVTEWAVTGRNLGKINRWLISGEGVAVIGMEAPSETALRVRVQVDERAEPGYREVRALGPLGLSNLALIRIDRLDQVPEAEPNDDPKQAGAITPGTAVIGTLTPQDLDHFRLPGRKGQRVTIEVEAQRVGSPVVPVMTIQAESGTPLGLACETQGLQHDCRMSLTLPADGVYVIQVRDHLYGGSEAATYRLRVADSPFATGMFPLGGPRGESITVTASGGNLATPLSKAIALPDAPGAIVEVGSFDGPDGPVLAPARLIVGDGPELTEAKVPETLPPGEITVNGRLDRPGEVDRYRVAAKRGESLGIRIRAAALGSWLDSVVTLKDEQGNILAEQDDLVDGTIRQGQFFLSGNASSMPDAEDSRIEFTARADGVLTIEVADRYGGGGPEYTYRLEVGPSRPDFTVSLNLDPNLNNRLAILRRTPRSNAPGTSGSLNLRPGTTTPINFLVQAQGKTGTIEFFAEGLPPGVTATPAKVQNLGGGRPGLGNRPAVPSTGTINLKVDAQAGAELGELRLVGVARPEGRGELRRYAVATVALGTGVPAAPPNQAVNVRPVLRTVTSIPIWVLGTAKKSPEPALTGPPKPLALALKGIRVPGPLLLGDRLEIPLEFDPPNVSAALLRIEAEVTGKGLAAQVIVPRGLASILSQAKAAAGLVRVLASVDAEVGERELTIRIAPQGGEPIVRRVPISVRPPIALKIDAETIPIAPGEEAMLTVEVRREPGFSRAVDLQFDGLPKGVKVVGPRSIPMNRSEGAVRITLADEPGLGDRPIALRVIGVVRMPQGPVQVECPNRPRLISRVAEK
ncbi:MAG: hypothetical protein IRY99_05115 [Isosphaeraceae bacterium]|nr:hypothetical protein [Isosphaeraceae bacterium]